MHKAPTDLRLAEGRFIYYCCNDKTMHDVYKNLATKGLQKIVGKRNACIFLEPSS